MKKLFMGVRLKRLREERRLTQQALADAIGISLSYLNQIENNQRPLTVAVLLRLNAAFGVDVQLFSDEDEARLVGELREALADPRAGEDISGAELKELAANMPAVGRAIVTLHRRLTHALDQSAALATRLGDDRHGGTQTAAAPFEEVRDFFYQRHNYIDALDRGAEAVSVELPDRGPAGLAARLSQRHGVRVVWEDSGARPALRRSFDVVGKILRLPTNLAPGQQAFQIGTQLALLEFGGQIDDQIAGTVFASPEARSLARIGLANYFAGALILPYAAFLAAAEDLNYDIDLLGQRFGVGFETVCHRLSTLQRPAARGVPFFFVRVDRAGNISKRQSATDFHFSRTGGTCPLWNIYEAFAQPGKVLTQLAEMPDGRTYLWVARAVSHATGGYGAPEKAFAVGLGCDLRYAGKLVYSRGLRLDDTEARTPIGMGCKICDRPRCAQRAFPSVGRALVVDETRSVLSPYSST
ncbi:Cro/Cl family transcriptional regulator [Labrys sp. WJW]|uniref:short-chain fatty acyl-CoA regulator family protein n=1 Tax=Labrys sp. WJW TaxID=1737983 RepID=UPI00082FF3F5|nr:short-chain fatty acyl-CoA regulator family protein [Labrys sp. WJW]OCC05467.1 Cro/Cl family transcriptional regulator [Labrys sp. WJW]